MSKSIQSDQTWTGTLGPHPRTLLLSHTVSHTLTASTSDFDWLMPTAVKVSELQEAETYSSQRKQRHFLKRSHRTSEKAAMPGRKWAALETGELK